MTRTALFLSVLFASSQGFAACFPPPGLGPQQWYSMCGPTMEDGYAQGMGRGLSHDDFMLTMYRMYLSSAAGPAPAMPQPGPVMQQCAVGTTQCFSGWLRRCEMRGYSAMWITGAQRCQ